jgi:hypothetical protein
MERDLLPESFAHRHFFIRPNIQFFETLDLSKVPAQYRGLSEAFGSNLLSVIMLASMPYFMTLSSQSFVMLRHELNRTTRAERERLKRPLTQDEVSDIFEKIVKDVESSHSSEGSVRRNAILDLETHSVSEVMSISAAELLRQSAVLTWGALEVLANDAFVALLNHDARIAAKFMSHKRVEGRVSSKEVMKKIQEHQFEVSGRMGSIISEQCRLDDIDSIKLAFEILLAEEVELHDLLNSSDLRKLNQQRNLILHRRSVVDRKYLDKTGESIPLGTLLTIDPGELERYLVIVRRTGIALLMGLRKFGA